MIKAYIGVGTNIDRERHSLAAFQELQQLGTDLHVSPIYECEPIGFSSQNFYNFVISFLRSCHRRVESASTRD